MHINRLEAGTCIVILMSFIIQTVINHQIHYRTEFTIWCISTGYKSCRDLLTEFGIPWLLINVKRNNLERFEPLGFLSKTIMIFLKKIKSQTHQRPRCFPLTRKYFHSGKIFSSSVQSPSLDKIGYYTEDFRLFGFRCSTSIS